jgi:hypothetical protein
MAARQPVEKGPSPKFDPLPGDFGAEDPRVTQNGVAFFIIFFLGALALAQGGTRIAPAAFGAIIAGVGVPCLFLFILFQKSVNDGSESTFRYSGKNGGRLFSADLPEELKKKKFNDEEVKNTWGAGR